ncbi:hypothetical protein [Streptomyces sp. NPDC001661]
MMIRSARTAFAVAALAVTGAAATPAVADDGGNPTCSVTEGLDKEYKYTVDSCQFIGQFGLNSLTHGGVLGKEGLAGELAGSGQ